MGSDTFDRWLPVAGIALLVVLLALVAHRIGRRLLRRVSRHAPVFAAVVKSVDRPLQYALPLVGLDVYWQSVPATLPGLDGVQHWTGILSITALTWSAVNAVHGLADGVIALNDATVADNLHARRVQTQARVLARTAAGILAFAGVALVLMTFPKARQLGASLLASAGVAGLVVGIAARSVFSNLLAGLQIALAQPIRIDDVLIVQGEWGRVEEITSTYVVLKIWDERRLIVPLQWFIENPFQNWTRTGSQILGTVELWVDFKLPLAPLRAEARRVVEASPDWDKRVFVVQVTDANERAMQVRVLVSSMSAGQNFDLRCLVREKLIDFIARRHPEALPRVRADAPALEEARS